MAGHKQDPIEAVPMRVKQYILATVAAVASLAIALTFVVSAAAEEEVPTMSVTNTGGIPKTGSNYCEYTLRFETCQLTVSNGSPFSVKIKAIELVGTEANVRYSIVTSGCKVGNEIASGKSCTDEVRLKVNKPAGAPLWSNWYFIEVEEVGEPKNRVAANGYLKVP
jgi:hypothetical protein